MIDRLRNWYFRRKYGYPSHREIFLIKLDDYFAKESYLTDRERDIAKIYCETKCIKETAEHFTDLSKLLVTRERIRQVTSKIRRKHLRAKRLEKNGIHTT